VKPLAFCGVVPETPELTGAMLEFIDLLAEIEFVSLPADCCPTSPAETSRWSGDECAGDADFLLAPSLPPRDEFRGETLPVCSTS
jgi:hypothetical protein